jgi:hypothetical protein
VARDDGRVTTDGPEVITMAGYYQELAEEGEYAQIELARWIEHDDGRVEIVVHDTELDYPWEARLSAEPRSRVFRGQMWSTQWDGRYELEAELWLSPDEDDDEILLLGTFSSEDEAPIDFKIVLYEEDEEDEEDDVELEED